MLNLAPIRAGQTQLQAVNSMVKLAQEAEKLGYERFWIAEHHNAPNLVSAATQVLIGHTLSHTKHIKVGSGGVMLPNHSPIMVAEQYGTLDILYPNRVELGLGRAPGTDPQTAMELRRNLPHTVEEFPSDVLKLFRFFGSSQEQASVKAFVAMGRNVPFYMLGSSTDSAHLAAALGMPYVFASHFAPRLMEEAVAIYKHEFKPSERLSQPQVIICLNIVAADNNEQAHFLASSQQQFFLGLVRGRTAPVQPPIDMTHAWTPAEQAAVEQMLAADIVGSKQSVLTQMKDLYSRTGFDELMTTNYIFDEQKQIYSAKLVKEILDENLF